MDSSRLHAHLSRELVSRRRPDGGFPTSLSGASEVEPTVLAALALPGDRASRSWIRSRQRADGGFGEPSGRHDGPTTAALAALVLDSERARRGLAFAVPLRGRPLPGAGGAREGWGWTADTRSFVEPTSRVLLAARRVTPSDPSVRGEATRLLREWQCRDGGWNHGVATVLGDDLVGSAQTTAIALIAVREETGESYVRDALAFLRRRWRREAGRLTLAQALVAFRLHGLEADARQVRTALEESAHRRRPAASTVALAWSALATGPDAGLARLRGAT